MFLLSGEPGNFNSCLINSDYSENSRFWTKYVVRCKKCGSEESFVMNFSFCKYVILFGKI